MPARAKTYEDEWHAVYNRQCGYYGLNTKAKQAEAFGISVSALKTYLKNPREAKMKHLYRIYKALHFTEKERDLLYNTGRMN